MYRFGFDFITVVGEAEVALAQFGEMRGEIEIVADFPVGAFSGFRLYSTTVSLPYSPPLPVAAVSS